MSYLEAFKNLPTDSFELIGDCLLVEEIRPEEQKTLGGIVLPTSKEIKQIDGVEANRPTWVRVLLVGAGYYDPKDESIVPLDVAPGDIILVGRLSVKWLSTFGPLVSSGENQIGITRESEIQLRFKGQAGQDAVFASLRSSLNLP